MPFLVGVVASLLGDWRAVGDNAVIAQHAWATLSAHAPLVGQPTRLGPGLYDPGPLEYWLLSIPVHLDPIRGVVWGAALWCAAAGTLTVIAARAVLGEAGAVLAAALVLGLTAWAPGISTVPDWNPWFGAMFFLAAIAAAWAVLCGRRWWWPVLVVTASIAAQAHLMFAIAAAGLAAAALVTGLVTSVREKTGFRWAIAGAAAGLVCWSAPLLQQFTGRRANLGALLSHREFGKPGGPVFGLRALGTAAGPRPIWLIPAAHLWRTNLHLLILNRSALAGLVMLAVTGVVLMVALRWLRCRPLAALAAISLILSGATAVTFARVVITPATVGTFDYLIIPLYPAGVLSWLTAGSAAALAARRLVSRWRRPVTAPESAGQRPARSLSPWVTRGAVAAAAALVLLAAVPGIAQPSLAFSGDPRLDGAVTTASGRIERELPPTRVDLSVSAPGNGYRRRLTRAMLWALTSAGYSPRAHVRAAGAARVPHVTVRDRHSGVAVTVTGGHTVDAQR